MTQLKSSSTYTSRSISIEALNTSVFFFCPSTAMLVFCSKQIPFSALPSTSPVYCPYITIPASSFRLAILHSCHGNSNH